MYKHILIATDGSELATKGVKHGIDLARKLDATVTIVTVTENWSALQMSWEVRSGHPNPMLEYDQNAEKQAKNILEAAGKIAQEQGVKAETLHVANHHPADGILETAKGKGCDLIVMASHGRRGIQRMLLGSQTAEVVARTTIPVLVVR